MRSYAALAFAGLAAAYGPGGDWGKDSWSSSKDAKPWGTGAPVYVTDIVTAYTTYCPSATQITHGTQTYTVTEATTLTITNCPCTVTRPVESWVASSSSCTTKPASVAPAPTSKPAASGAPAPGTTYFPSVVAPSSAAPVASAPATYTGAASKAQVAGAGLLAVMGAAVVAL